ncbi:hypothetical protein SLEP1_g29829 [Rubroshorea leprosula]|uniref:Uncharacterized protein n=1 Tax=Rubroshorea leprosula TaxID=152421 RepID=A0AAV5K6D6_9ROSI|nr:hypothetical protein SLEP1_g29829 [Rubroshorea leprosula]
MNDSREFCVLLLTWLSLRKNKAGDWRKEGRGVFGLLAKLPALVGRCGRGVDGNKLFLALSGVLLATGEAKEKERALSGEIKAGPSGDGLVGPTLDADVFVKLRYHGFSESKWWDTQKADRQQGGVRVR